MIIQVKSTNTALQPSTTEIVIRPYRDGDEARIVDFLNQCFGNWGNLEKWQGAYQKYPTFDKDTILIVEKDGEMIGHRGLHFRDLALQGDKKVLTVSMGDTAIHSRHRGAGIFSRLNDITFPMAAAKGACMVFSWAMKGSTGYHGIMKEGFVEIKQSPAYMKIINPERVFKRGMFDLVTKNQKLRKTLMEFDNELCFCLGKSEFPLRELFGKTGQIEIDRTRIVKFVFHPSALLALANFRNRGRYWRIRCLVSLVLLGKAKVRFGSFKAFTNLVRNTGVILGSI